MLVTAIILTLKLAFITTAVLMLLGTPFAWALSRMRHGLPGKVQPLLEAMVALPLVLPPTVLGFYFLLAFSPENPFGQLWVDITGSTLAFSFIGLVIASVIYSLPFVIQPLQRAFEQIDPALLEASAMLGATPIDRFFTVVLPLCRRTFLLAACMGFAHTVGEFGVVLMIGGNIPGETQVLSIALFDAVETQQFAKAHIIAGGLVIFSLVLLMMLYSIDRKESYGRSVSRT